MIQVMVPYNYTEFINGLTDLVNKKAIRIQRIDDAVKRILRVKFAMGLFENPLADYSFADKLGCKVGVDSARRLRPVFFISHSPENDSERPEWANYICFLSSGT